MFAALPRDGKFVPKSHHESRIPDHDDQLMSRLSPVVPLSVPTAVRIRHVAATQASARLRPVHQWKRVCFVQQIRGECRKTRVHHAPSFRETAPSGERRCLSHPREIEAWNVTSNEITSYHDRDATDVNRPIGTTHRLALSVLPGSEELELGAVVDVSSVFAASSKRGWYHETMLLAVSLEDVRGG